MTVWVVLERRGRETHLVGVYATEEVAREAAAAMLAAEVIPCVVLDQAP